MGLALGITAMLAVLASTALGATGANFVATGHDMDYHCAGGTTEECEYLKIVVDKVRNGSTLPILALDQGTELPTALANAGYTGVGEVVTVNPAESAAFSATAFVDKEGHPLYSAIITASDETCGGCDDNEEGENNINARASDFATYFNGGGGILALAGAGRYETYYNFVPLKVGATAVSPPFEVTPEGATLGITSEMANCCATHNSFDFPPPEPLVTLEKDTAGKAETIAAFGATITEKGFSSIATQLSGEGKSGTNIAVKEGTAVTDTATLAGPHAGEATGKVEYRVFSDKECKSEAANAGSVTVVNGVVPASNPESFNTPGTYYWQASYTGDANNKAAESECGEEVETVGEGGEPPKESFTATTLSGGGQSGATITVPTGAAVSDSASLSGANAAAATGSVTYKVFSDKECKSEVADAGTVTVAGGTVPASDAETLPTGTYYWQAVYSGDSGDTASSSACGSEVETVVEGPPPSECTASGSARFRVKREIQTVADRLSTDLTAKQTLKFKWNKEGKHELQLTSLTSAVCVVKPHRTTFEGQGTATVNGIGGYTVSFSLTVTSRQKFILQLRYQKGHERAGFHDAARTSEVIASS